MEMEDKQIVALYWERSETAIAETEAKYGRYCRYIADHILHSEQDVEECVNDTYQKAWETIPPKKPELLYAYLGRITRNLAINRCIHDSAQKRASGFAVILEEAEECIPDPSHNDLTDELHLRQAIQAFVASLPRETRMVFVRRYWYMSSVKEIAADYGMTESKVKVMLMRTRKKFKEHLEREEISI